MIKRFSVSLTINAEANKEATTITLVAESGPVVNLEFDGLAAAVAECVSKQVMAIMPDQARIKKVEIESASEIKKLQEKLASLSSPPAPIPAAVPVVAVEDRPRHRRSRE